MEFLDASRRYRDGLERERNELRAEVACLKEEQKRIEGQDGVVGGPSDDVLVA